MNEEALAPVFHVTDSDAAVAWYQRLGFVVNYEHASGPAFSRATVALNRGELVLILSNREEDAHSSGLVYLRISNPEAIAEEFGIEVKETPVAWHFELIDLDGNRLRIGKPKFVRPIPKGPKHPGPA
jgi:hypothetical protein